jgi:hypothetical protein
VSTLIAVYNSEGCVGRCDKRCYDADNPRCTCICQGKNHQAGQAQAEDNTRVMADSWLDDLKARGIDVGHIERAIEVQHAEALFSAGELAA